MTQERLYSSLGPERAAYASPIMLVGGEVQWHSFLDGDKGETGKHKHILPASQRRHISYIVTFC